MKLIINTPNTLRSERIKLTDELIELLKQQQRSCLRYAARMQTIRNKIEKIDKML